MMTGLNIIIEKLSQYNFVTNILPGTILCILLKYIVGYDLFVSENWILMGVIFYFIGVINNRFGSLFVEWLSKKTKFVKFAPYKDFVKAESIDSKITTLNTENNVFRSYVSLCILIFIAYLFKIITNHIDCIKEWTPQILILALLILFLLSYRKQTTYIRKRVEAKIKNPD